MPVPAATTIAYQIGLIEAELAKVKAILSNPAAGSGGDCAKIIAHLNGCLTPLARATDITRDSKDLSDID